MFALRKPGSFVDLMLTHGITQRQLAAKAGVSQAFISQLVSGIRNARPVTAWRIACALDVTTGELFEQDAGRKTPCAPSEKETSNVIPTGDDGAQPASPHQLPDRLSAPAGGTDVGLSG